MGNSRPLIKGLAKASDSFHLPGTISQAPSPHLCVSTCTQLFTDPLDRLHLPQGVIPSVSYIINNMEPSPKGQLGNSNWKQPFEKLYLLQVSPVSYQISVSNHGKILHLIKLLSHQSDQSPMS